MHQPRSVCEVEVAAQQLRDELKLGSPKELRQGGEVRGVEGQLGSLQQTREVKIQIRVLLLQDCERMGLNTLILLTQMKTFAKSLHSVENPTLIDCHLGDPVALRFFLVLFTSLLFACENNSHS